MQNEKSKARNKKFCDKYLGLLNTTDFGIMFLTMESLYIEVLIILRLSDVLQKNFKVTIARPTTSSAILNSLQMDI
ncbi:DNA recombination protein RmuC [Thermoanaerobacter ethanolicus]|uniref:DNA recombination protein RmuC n=1 Tax=Thermoanaerobacter ethanolicus TaxID=1757 RepID=UPI0005B500D4